MYMYNLYDMYVYMYICIYTQFIGESHIEVLFGDRISQHFLQIFLFYFYHLDYRLLRAFTFSVQLSMFSFQFLCF